MPKESLEGLLIRLTRFDQALQLLAQLLDSPVEYYSRLFESFVDILYSIGFFDSSGLC